MTFKQAAIVAQTQGLIRFTYHEDCKRCGTRERYANSSKCVECSNQTYRKYCVNNLPRIRANQKAWARKNKEYLKSYNLSRKLGRMKQHEYQ